MLDNDRLVLLLDNYADRSISSDELAELEDLLRRSPEARDRFWSELRWNGLIRTWGEASGGSAMPSPSAPTVSVSRRIRGLARQAFPIPTTPALAAAVLVAMVVGVTAVRWLLGPGTSGLPQPADVAVVTDARNPRWHGEEFAVGETVGPRRLVLEEGEVTLGLVSGAKVVLRGPADFSIRSGLRLQLLAGSLAARVPPEAEGFIVDTPSVDVVDLGTEFAVSAALDGIVDVAVQRGRVETRLGNSHDTRIDVLTAGMARRFHADGRSEANPPLERGQFPVLPVDEGLVPVGSGAIHVLASPPSSLAELKSNEVMLLFQEARGVRLPSQLSLDIDSPGIYADRKAIRPSRAPQGRLVDAYLLHFKARTQFAGGGPEGLVLDGSVTFPRPIVGVACLPASLDASDVVTRSIAKTAGALAYRGLEFGPQDQDQLVLSTDRRTLWVSLKAAAYIDQIRIFVEPGG